MPFPSSTHCFAYPIERHRLRRNCALIPNIDKFGTIHGFKNWPLKRNCEMRKDSVR